MKTKHLLTLSILVIALSLTACGPSSISVQPSTDPADDHRFRYRHGHFNP